MTARNIPQACYCSIEAVSGLVLRRRVHVWVCIVGRAGGWWADLHRARGGEGEPREPAVGHQEDLHGRYTLPEQVAGKRLHVIAILEIGFVFCFVFLSFFFLFRTRPACQALQRWDLSWRTTPRSMPRSPKTPEQLWNTSCRWEVINLFISWLDSIFNFPLAGISFW